MSKDGGPATAHEAFRLALEAAAKVCESEMLVELNMRDPGNPSYREGHDDGCTDCASAIRALRAEDFVQRAEEATEAAQYPVRNPLVRGPAVPESEVVEAHQSPAEMSADTKTPRTDAEAFNERDELDGQRYPNAPEVVSADFARQLELENADLAAKLASAEAALRQGVVVPRAVQCPQQPGGEVCRKCGRMYTRELDCFPRPPFVSKQ